MHVLGEGPEHRFDVVGKLGPAVELVGEALDLAGGGDLPS